MSTSHAVRTLLRWTTIVLSGGMLFAARDRESTFCCFAVFCLVIVDWLGDVPQELPPQDRRE